MIRKLILGMSALACVLSLVVFGTSLCCADRYYYSGYSRNARVWRVGIINHRKRVHHGQFIRCGVGLPRPTTTRFAGVVYSTHRIGWSRAATVNRFLRIPTWMPPVVFGAFPLISLWGIPRRRRKLRRARGQCVTCGYDLTGNLSGVCPECGTPCHEEKPWTTPGGFGGLRDAGESVGESRCGCTRSLELKGGLMTALVLTRNVACVPKSTIDRTHGSLSMGLDG